VKEGGGEGGREDRRTLEEVPKKAVEIDREVLLVLHVGVALRVGEASWRGGGGEGGRKGGREGGREGIRAWHEREQHDWMTAAKGRGTREEGREGGREEGHKYTYFPQAAPQRANDGPYSTHTGSQSGWEYPPLPPSLPPSLPPQSQRKGNNHRPPAAALPSLQPSHPSWGGCAHEG